MVTKTRAPRRWSLLCSAAACALSGAPALAQEPGAFEEGLFELFVQRIPDRVPLLTLVDAAGQVLIPLRGVLDHVGIPVNQVADTLYLEWPPAVWRTRVSPTERVISVGESATVVPASEWVVRGGESYVSARALAAALAARVDVQWADLVIVVSGEHPFPATTRMEVAARRARERLQASLADPTGFADVPYPARSGGLAGGWGLSLAETSGLTFATARGALGASLLGGGVEAGATGVSQEGRAGRIEDPFARYVRVFPRSRWVQKVEAGSVLADGILARRLLGVTLTNEPFSTPRYFGEAVVTPAVPAGWDYEVYQGDHLVGVSTADQPDEIRMPLNYGNTPVRVRMIGPAGQEIEEELIYLVPAERAPPGSWRYSVGGGACEDLGCDTHFFGELSRGFTRWLTASVGADRLDDGASAPVRPFGSVGVSPVPSLSAEIQVRSASFLRGSVQYLAGAGGVLTAAYSWLDSSPETGPGGWAGQASASASVPFLAGRWVSARLLMRGQDHGTLDSWQGALSTSVRRSHFTLELESGLQPGTLVTGRIFQALLQPRSGFLQDASLHGAVGFSSGEVALGEAGATLRMRVGPVIDGRLRLRRGQDPTFTLGVSLRAGLGFFQARGSRGAAASSFLSADGGLAYGSDAGFMALPYQSVGRGGVAGQVYFDLDGDGVRGPDEPPVEGADVLVAGRRATTDGEGRFSSWEATPFEGLVVSIDSLTLDPEWAPSEREVRLRPSPNVFTSVSLGVHRTRELLGSVQTADSIPRAVGGVRVEVIDADGEVVASERTFSDGVFYIARVRPGRVRVRVSPASMGPFGGGEPPTVEIEVPPEGSALLELPALVVEGTRGR
ncbi:MAG: hypothetical protein WEB90_04400 [Gemmatimonadota bacterium]